MKNQTLRNAEVQIQTAHRRLKRNETRSTTTTLLREADRTGENACLLIIEKTHTAHPEKRWQTKSRTLHLTLKANESHIQVIGYIRRDQIANNRQLGDLLCLEAEQLSANLEDMEVL